MGYIYKIIDTTTNEYYIGKSVSKSPKTDNYWGSGINRLCRSAKKHNGAEGRYRKDVLVNGISCKIELGLFEKEILGNLFETDSLCLNRKAGGKGGSEKGQVRSQKTKDLMSTAKKGNTYAKGKKRPPRTAEQNRVQSARMMGKNKGKVRTDEQKAAHSAALKEYWRLRKIQQQQGEI